MAEQQFRRAVAISQGDYTIFLSLPISATLLVAAAAILIVPMLFKRRQGTTVT